MRVALKIAYDGRSFYGHQRQPDARTVEGECLNALKAAGIVHDLEEAFFRSASRTDRGVSAVGNVIAFNTRRSEDALVGAFNDRSRDVWSWAIAVVPPTFHPRHALERWYRYHLLDDVSVDRLRAAAAVFVGEHNLRSFTSDPAKGLHRINRIDVTRDEGLTRIDFGAPSFRRGMIRRIVGAMVGHAKGEIPLSALRAALGSVRRDFGMARAEPLFLMDVAYDFPFQTVLNRKRRDEWDRIHREAALRLLLANAWKAASSGRQRD